MNEACPNPTSIPIRSFMKSILADGSPRASNTDGWLSHPFSVNFSSSSLLKFGRDREASSQLESLRMLSISCLRTSLLMAV